jgi:dihydrofolate reductase
LKHEPNGGSHDIYLVGGARTTASLIDAGPVEEVRLIVYPLIAGQGRRFFAATKDRRCLKIRKVQRLQGGRVSLLYGNKKNCQS